MRLQNSDCRMRGGALVRLLRHIGESSVAYKELPLWGSPGAACRRLHYDRPGSEIMNGATIHSSWNGHKRNNSEKIFDDHARKGMSKANAFRSILSSNTNPHDRLT